jgi:hypothetical protein
LTPDRGPRKTPDIRQKAKVRLGQIRLVEGAGLECIMSETAIVNETASTNSGENRSVIILIDLEEGDK